MDQLSLESQSRGCAKTSILAVVNVLNIYRSDRVYFFCYISGLDQSELRYRVYTNSTRQNLWEMTTVYIQYTEFVNPPFSSLRTVPYFGSTLTVAGAFYSEKNA